MGRGEVEKKTGSLLSEDVRIEKYDQLYPTEKDSDLYYRNGRNIDRIYFVERREEFCVIMVCRAFLVGAKIIEFLLKFPALIEILN